MTQEIFCVGVHRKPAGVCDHHGVRGCQWFTCIRSVYYIDISQLVVFTSYIGGGGGVSEVDPDPIGSVDPDPGRQKWPPKKSWMFS